MFGGNLEYTHCIHCNEYLPGMGMANHLATCDKNPDNIHQVDIFFGDRTFYKTVTVKAVDMDDALESVQIPKGGYAKPTK